jgi:hypothetical protein
MKSLQHFAVMVFLAVLACTGLHALSFDFRANIPFEFRAGDTLMPSGEYLVHGEGPWVILRATDGSRQTPILMTIDVAGGNPKEARLDFNRYGSEYFLTSIWDSFSQDGRQVGQTAREKEVAKRRGLPAPTAVTIASTK